MSLDFNAHARTDDLEIQEMGDELLVYDRRNDMAHCLSPTAASVWRSLGYRDAVDTVVARFGAETVSRTVEALRDQGLLTESAGMTPAEQVSRRQLVKRMAGAAVAGSVIVSVAAPPAAWAASCAAASNRNQGCPCTQNNQCASGNCNGSNKCTA